MFWNWFRRLAAPHRRRPTLETLEDRCVPATFIVNTHLDTNDALVGDGIAADSLGFTSLRAAIEEAQQTTAADTIQFAIPQVITEVVTEEGTTTTTYTPAINLLSALPTITEALHIDGPNLASQTVRRGTSATYRIFTFAGGGTTPEWMVDDLWIENGKSDAGGGGIAVFGGTKLTVLDCVFEGNTATGDTAGGALRNNACSLVDIISCQFHQNAAKFGGAVSTTSGTTSILGSVIHLNTAEFGGGVHHQGSGETDIWGNSEIRSNTATSDGGGIFVSSGVVNMTGGVLSLNTANRDGGGFFGTASTSHFDGVTVNDNHAAVRGGGMFLDNNMAMTLEASTVQFNTATLAVPGIAYKATATITLLNPGNTQTIVLVP